MKLGQHNAPTTKIYIFFGIAIFLSLPIPSNLYALKKNTPASERVVKLIHNIRTTLTASEYRHRTRVREKTGEYYFDCSGMATWILKRSAPRAFEAVGTPNDRRPLARNFFSTIARIKPGKRKGPWMRPGTIADAEPGDLIAWIRPKWFPSKSTGHVAFVVDAPKPNPGPVPGLLFRIADASKFRHEDDSRSEGETGFGIGTLLIPTDPNGLPIGYGWVGSRTEPDWIVPTDIVIGRPLR